MTAGIRFSAVFLFTFQRACSPLKQQCHLGTSSDYGVLNYLRFGEINRLWLEPVLESSQNSIQKTLEAFESYELLAQ